MTRYGQDEDPKEKGVSQPHSDCMENVRFFNRLIDKCIWNRLHKHEASWYMVSDEVIDEYVFNHERRNYDTVMKIKEYKSCTFMIRELVTWPRDLPVDPEKRTTIVLKTMNVSFHQKNQDFRVEFCNILNHFHSKGIISKKGLSNNQPQARKQDWDKLF